jgi:hypothetical protein
VTDVLDHKIRSYLVELVDAAPAPPEFDAIDQLSSGMTGQPTHGSRVYERSAWRWPSNRSRLLAGAALVASASVIGGVIVASNQGGDGVRVPSVDATTQPSPAAASPPGTVTGTEQPLDRVEVPPELSTFFEPSSRVTNYSLQPDSTPHAFVVDGSPVFVVAHVSGGGPTDDVANQTYPGVLVLTMPVPGSVAQGIGSWYRSDAELSNPQNSLFNEWDWPLPRQRWIWTAVPSGAAFVTVAYGSDVQLWQRPLDGVAAFSFLIPEAQLNQPASSDDPVARMRAYSGDGTLLETVDGAPR